MTWDFETEPEFQQKLDWVDTFVREEVEPLDLLWPHQQFVPLDETRRKVVDPLKELIAAGRPIGHVLAIGPVRMMQAVAEVTRPHRIPTVVSLNSLMVDGTGMARAMCAVPSPSKVAAPSTGRVCEQEASPIGRNKSTNEASDRSRLDERLALGVVRGRRQRDDRDTGHFLHDLGRGLDAVQGRHAVVHQHDVRPVFFRRRHGGDSVPHRGDDFDVVPHPEEELESVAKYLVVLHEHDPDWRHPANPIPRRGEAGSAAGRRRAPRPRVADERP